MPSPLPLPWSVLCSLNQPTNRLPACPPTWFLSQVYGEFSLFQEGEALKDIAATPIGVHPDIDVVVVKHNSPKCLVMSVGNGKTASKIMRQFDHSLPTDQQPKHIQHLMQLLEEFHRCVFEAFVQDGIIHSDVHLGNMIIGSLSESDAARTTENGEGGRLILFDVGQFERVSPPETLAILWTLVALRLVRAFVRFVCGVCAFSLCARSREWI